MCFLRVDFGDRGVARKPETRHADLSPPPEQGTTLREGDASWGYARPPASGWRSGPFLSRYSPPPPTFCVGPTQRPPPAPPPPSPLPSQVRKPALAEQPWLPATRALAGLRALSSCTTPIPQSRLDETNPEAARKGRSGRRWGPAAGPGVPAPALSCSPTGSSQMGRALSLCLPRSLDRSLRPGYLGGLQDGTAREGSLCAAPRE